ncbi:hypothetical protein [Intrasporangium calvum]|nr:hypothetical protein [Intrasporangium calvum]
MDRVPYCFAAEQSLFPKVQAHLGAGLKIDPAGVRLVGSGCVGFSVAPDTFPKPFHSGSDLDFAIVSKELFDTAWHGLLSWGHPRRHTLPGQENQWFGRRKDEIFWGWIDVKYLHFRGLRFVDDLKPLQKLRAAWFDTFQSIGAEFPGTEIAGREVSGRLYRSEEHLIQYQAEGLRKLRYRLAVAREKEASPHGLQ